MNEEIKTLMVPDEVVMSKIYLIRGQKVMLDSDLAALYGIETKNLNKAIKEISADSRKILCSDVQKKNTTF